MIAGSEDRINELGDQGNLLIQFGFTPIFQMLFPAPSGPLGLRGGIVAGQVWTNRF